MRSTSGMAEWNVTKLMNEYIECGILTDHEKEWSTDAWTAWMTLENIILTEGLSQQDPILYHFICLKCAE